MNDNPHEPDFIDSDKQDWLRAEAEDVAERRQEMEMDNEESFRFRFTIETESGEVLEEGSTFILPRSINEYGECESVDMETGMKMKNIYKALADFQQSVPVILKDTTGYGYKYADLPAIFEIINPLLKKNGLGFYQAVNNASIKTVIFHIETGESVESDTNIPQGVSLKGMNDFQVLGSAITYIKRYALSSLLGLVTDKDNDASGEQINKKNNDNDVPF